MDSEELERTATLGWRPLETASLGEWQLRAGGGFTGRANSVLAVGDPGVPIAEATATVEGWYAARNLPARAQVIEDEPADNAFAGLGWLPSAGVDVMTANATVVLNLRPVDANLNVTIDATPDDDWLALFRGGGEVPDAARTVLVAHPQVRFISLRAATQAATQAVARVAVDGIWAGIFAVEVDPALRRRGLGSAVTVAAVREAVALGAEQVYLQVADGNPAAVLYRRLGFMTHHRYRYRSAG